ncbi:prepilin-type N-terminal cleavage/methylation domain-containing protein [Alteromonas sp. A081]|uniref:prepilin-type N-terminal cleavage/methylation domain-containing protein n=1 Tax=Alteromonas sp. A081 TaxID=3410269 RepID=UPI003B9815FF
MLKRRGFSLVELLVATGIASTLLVLASRHTAFFYSALLKIQQTVSIEAELQALQHVITAHLEQAGYIEQSIAWQLAVPPASLPSINISHFSNEASDSCFTFSYDKNSDGTISLTPNEFFGFRLRDKAIEYRVAKRSCSQSHWQDLTDTKDVRIDEFSITRLNVSGWGVTYEIYIKASSSLFSGVETSTTFVVEVANVK